MGHTKHLAMLGHRPQQIGHLSTDATAHTTVDLVEQQGAGTIHIRQTGFKGQKKTRHLSS